MNKSLKVLLASSEVVPFAKTGGLADVAGALPKALKKLGHDARIVLPKYKMIDDAKFGLKEIARIKVPLGEKEEEAVIKTAVVPGTDVKVYFIDNPSLYGRDALYQEKGVDYPDNHLRFAFFSRAVLEMMKALKWYPDVIHCNDWQTGLIPVYLKALYWADPLYQAVGTVITIHNIAYQGNFPREVIEEIGLAWDLFNSDKLEFWGNVSFLKGGLVYADVINTVSKTYAVEIQTTNEYGRGLEGLLTYRKKDLYGIVNGLDYEEWNPATDKFLPVNYNADSADKKKEVKKALLEENGLKQKDNFPLLGLISRLDDQKGFDILAEVMPQIAELDLQFVLLGTGDPKYHTLMENLKKKYPEKFAVNLKFDNALAHRIYAGSDLFLMPSRFEPCGLGQLISLKYGTIPVVRKTGGLADTIKDYNEDPDNGLPSREGQTEGQVLLDAVKRALKTYNDEKKWKPLVRRAMLQDWSWSKSAAEYVELYKISLGARQGVMA
ncbi:MAG: glycogen synthase GlgA [Firmicutes bacterium]|nr:glycogen synthase GlgA [Bacillota bacterium]